jgi:indolepyruvate ferredoxin oxidoreductase
MAAHLEGKGVGVLDMAGLAQKGGSVWTHMRFGASPQAIAAVRVAPGGADALIGCDLVVAAAGNTLTMTRKGATRAIVNTQEVMPGAFTQNPDMQFPAHPLVKTIARAIGEGNLELVDAGRLALALCGDAIATNLFMLGAAYQRGLVPVGAQAIERAIELNGAAVKMNLAAFRWGRRHAVDPQAVAASAGAVQRKQAASLDEAVQRRVEFLTGYQNAAYAARFKALVDAVRAHESRVWPGQEQLTSAVARSFFKLMAYKDEYEVARLYAAPAFRAQIDAQFEGAPRLAFNLAPPLLGDKKREFGAWMLPAFGVLARLKFLRGTALDPFGRTEERRHERAMIDAFEALVQRLLKEARPDQHELAVQIAQAPLQVRGYGHVKEAARQAYEAELAQLLQRLQEPQVVRLRAA